MALLDRIKTLNTFDPSAYVPFIIEGTRVGHIARETLPHLAPFTNVVHVDEDGVTLSPDLADHDSRTQAFRSMLLSLRDMGLVPYWREEAYAVKTAFSEPALMEMERAATPLFGVQGYGVHMNGIVRTDEGVKMWIGRRAKDKPTFPGKLDQMVAGGHPAGADVFENLIKECAEEAAIPEDLARQARPVGTISYLTTVPGYGIRHDILFNYDLELPADFQPTPLDGEMEAFYLWPVEQVMETVAHSQAFKYNCAAIVVDFLIRWGYIQPNDPDYVELVSGLHYR